MKRITRLIHRPITVRAAYRLLIINAGAIIVTLFVLAKCMGSG